MFPGARWTGNAVTAVFRPAFDISRTVPLQVAGLGRQHKADPMVEQPLPWSDPLPGRLLQLFPRVRADTR